MESEKALYLDDAYSYLKATLKMSAVFKFEFQKIFSAHNTRDPLFKNPAFIKLLNRFEFPEWLHEQIAQYITTNGSANFFSDEITVFDPFGKYIPNGRRLIPQVILSIPINATKEDLKKCWDLIQERRASYDSIYWQSRSFSKKNTLWRDGGQFDTAFIFFELTKKEGQTTREAVKTMLETNLIPEISLHKNRMDDSSLPNLVRNAEKIVRQIAALKLTYNVKGLTRNPKKSTPNK